MWPTILIEAGMKLIDKLFPDPTAKAEAQLKLLQLQQTGELAELNANLQLAQGQMETNKQEAASASVFVSGWRPFIGWICGVAFGFNFIAGPLLTWIAALKGVNVDFPKMEWDAMMPVLLGMLGLGGMRTYEKKIGVS